jgi:CHASE2 domain-containing sensor protein
VTGHDPHAPATLGFEVAAVVCGMLFALLGGYVGTVIAHRRDLYVTWYVAAILIVMATWSLLASGYSWSPVAALVCMAPAVLVGGWLHLRQH